ncbi:MAG: hypothetical protein QOD06_2143, partial [Candidatus Binatota bacterium]|nr:hypothetical protein [Candidatus Binatota bacterium]
MNPDWKHERVTANGIQFHVVTAGSTSAPLVVLLHGFPEFWYAWRHQIPALAEHFRVAVPDLRGYGDSDKPPRVADYAIDVLAADVAGLVRALGESKATIVGHDWGGGVAWATALEHPDVVEKLIVLNCPHPAKFARALRTNFRQLRRSWYMFFFQLPRIPERLLLRKDAAILDTMFRGMAKRPGTFSDEDLRELKQAIQKPGAATGAINYYRAAFRNFRL